MNIFSPHIEFDKLADLAEERSAPEERRQLLNHLKECRRCSEKLRNLKGAIETMRADKMEDAPAHAFESVRGMLRAHIKPAPSAFKQTIAALKFDSLNSAPAFAMRSAAVSERQLLFSAGQTDIHLQIRQQDEQWIISGQALGDCSGGEAELAGASFTTKAPLSELCEFTLDPAPQGTYVLTLRLSGGELKVTDLKLGS
jgi:hypothetical protein